MVASYSFHPEALLEYAEAANYYLNEASAGVADRFVTAVESTIAELVSCSDTVAHRGRSGDSPLPLQSVPVHHLLPLGGAA